MVKVCICGGVKMVLTVTINPAVDKTYIIDNFEPFAVNRAQRIIYNAGSNGVNVSRVLKQVSRENLVLGFVGGHNGSVFLSELAADGIKEDMVRVEGDIRLNVKIIDMKNHTTTEVNEQGNPISEKEHKEFVDKYKNYVDDCDAVVLSGSMLPEMSKNEYYELVKIAKNAGKPTFVDCDGETLRRTLDAGPSYVKLNYLEFCDMVGKSDITDDEIVQEAKEIIEKGKADYVVVTLSSKGAIGVSANEIYKVIPPTTEVQSTVGSGDAFMAGLCHAYLNGFNFRTQLVLATSFGSAKVTKEGNNVPSLVELLGYADGCIVEELKL